MDARRTTPLLRENVDLLRNGPNNSTAFQTPLHPVQVREQNFHKNNAEFRTLAMNNLFGTHMQMRFQMENAILGEFARLPGLQTDYTGLETMLDLDENLDFYDFLGDPSCPEHSVDIHQVMEHKLNL
eukprot:TRINITY_DN527_c0_g1_i1.p1 TRINITY_DN527_c0_g1~~TRINITY_DN527_c0_g1_i1.p1  ORF type:complete len:138 (-),score=30.30 TRINITY_DN527_c0_g1_i1:144-524(-)